MPAVNKIVPIFSGGGTRLLAHIGILKALSDLNVQFSSLVGISGGSIVAALHSYGLSNTDLYNLAVNTDFKQFRDFSIFRLLRYGGLSSGVKFERWMDKQIDGMTFADAPIPLHILATDVNGGGPVIFNKEQTPNMRVSHAVRCSMSIPLLFSFKMYEKHMLVDGAILAEDALFQDWQRDGTPNVCFRLRSEAREQPFNPKRFILPQYIGLLIRTFMTALSREYVHAEHWHNTLVINTGSASSVDFDMDETDKEALFQQGYQTAMNFLPAKLQRLERPVMPVL